MSRCYNAGSRALERRGAIAGAFRVVGYPEIVLRDARSDEKRNQVALFQTVAGENVVLRDCTP